MNHETSPDPELGPGLRGLHLLRGRPQLWPEQPRQ